MIARHSPVLCMMLTKTSWWLNQPIWNICAVVKLDGFPNVQGENKTFFKTPPRSAEFFSSSQQKPEKWKTMHSEFNYIIICNNSDFLNHPFNLWIIWGEVMNHLVARKVRFISKILAAWRFQVNSEKLWLAGVCKHSRPVLRTWCETFWMTINLP